MRNVGFDVGDVHMCIDQAGNDIAAAQIFDVRVLRNGLTAARVDRLDALAVDDDRGVGLGWRAGAVDDGGVG